MSFMRVCNFGLTLLGTIVTIILSFLPFIVCLCLSLGFILMSVKQSVLEWTIQMLHIWHLFLHTTQGDVIQFEEILFLYNYAIHIYSNTFIFSSLFAFFFLFSYLNRNLFTVTPVFVFDGCWGVELRPYSISRLWCGIDELWIVTLIRDPRYF